MVASDAATISWIAFHHLVVWLEACLGDLIDFKRLLGEFC